MAESAGPAGDPLGALLAQVRGAQGRTQLRIAELLCAASGTGTVSRHEVSRWERGHRVPSPYWLGWLAVVLDLPLAELERAAAVSRRSRPVPATAPDPTGGPDPATGPAGGPAGRPGHRPGRTLPVRRWSIAELRRLDDQVGGPGLHTVVNDALRAATARVGAEGWANRAHLAGLAQLAQLAGWVNGDAGLGRAAWAAHRLGLRAARAADDPALVGHLLGSAAHLTADPARAVALGRAAVDEATRTGSATVRALALQRLALAAARAGDPRRCDRAVSAAERMFGRRRPDVDPPWVYWLTEAEFAAMTGRCFAVLHRPRLAVPLLTHALAGIGAPRASALYRSWLAQAHLAAGAPDAAAPAAAEALLDAVRSGSVRAAVRAHELHARLLVAPRRAVTGYLAVATGALPYLSITGHAARADSG